MKKLKLLFILLIFLAGNLLLANNNLTINVTGQSFYNELPISVIDPIHPESQPIFISLNIINNTEEEIEYYILLNFSWNSNNIMSDEKITAENPIAANGILQFTNRDFVSNNSSDFDSSLDLDDIINEIEEFKDNTLAAGKLPDGNYSFSCIAYDQATDEQISAQSSYEFTIQSPVYINLIYPGQLIGSGLTEISTNSPIFSWFGFLNNSSADDFSQTYNFELYEFDSPSISSSDIIEGNIVFKKESLTENNFNLTPSHYSLLESKYYAWRITSKIVNPLSEEYNKSDVFTFKYNQEAEKNPNEYLVNFFNTLSNEEAQIIIDTFNEGYSLEKIYLDNSEISVEELITLLQEFISKNKKIKSISIK